MMACACDVHPCLVHEIPAGLTALPRAAGAFPHWRRELMVAISRQGALRDWRAREEGDFGMMLVDFFAYMADVTSFYDALVANESYLTTAIMPDAARQLVALLGYLPRPGLAASAWLAAEADGVRLVTLPAATAFRSGEFDGNPPQVFESGGSLILEPRVNRLPVDRVPATTLPASLSAIGVKAGTLRARRNEIIVLDMAGTLAAARVRSIVPVLTPARAPVTEIQLAAAVAPPAGATYSSTRILRSGNRAGAWKLPPGSGEPTAITATELSLDSRIDIAADDVVVVEAEGTFVARRVTKVTEVLHTLLSSLTSTLTDADDNVSTMVSPAIRSGVTRITLGQPISFSATATDSLILHYGFNEAGTIHVPLKDTLEQGDPVRVPSLAAPARTPVTTMALEDAHGQAVVTTGILDPVAKAATPDGTPPWGMVLDQPVTLAGNMLLATRGESVRDEVLGAGDASVASQRFRLKKKPLTYLPAANSVGRVSALVIRIGGIMWNEVESFYGRGEDEPVYIVRHDEAGETDVEFGGGARVPTGATIVASYRFGAGAAVPPAESIKQVARPVIGLRSVRNPLPAFGGADAEAPAAIGIRGPASALLLGRAVSLLDFEHAALERSGVRAARAAWRWDEDGQRPAVVLRYIGDAQLAPSIRAALRAIAEEDAPLSVLVSPAEAASLAVDLDVDSRFVSEAVADAVGQALFAPVILPGTGGLLRGERLGPDGVIFASVVIAAIMAVDGVAALRGLALNGTPFTDTGRVPAAGAWFDFSAGGITVNGRQAG